MRILILFFLLLTAPAFAADPVTYDPATGEVTMTLAPKEKADLRRASNHLKVKESDLLKQTMDNWLRHVGEQMVKVREQNLRERYEKLTPDQRKTVEDVMGPIP